MSDDNTPEAGRTVVLTLQGERFQAPRLPAGFTAARSRGAEAAAVHGQFLPPGFLIPRETIALGGATSQRRGSPAVPTQTLSLDVASDEVVVLELADGGLLITRGERLQKRVLSEAPGAGERGVSRGLIGDLVGEQISRVYTVAFGALPADDPVVADLGGKVEDWLIDQVGTPLARKGVAGVVWAIERRLLGLCGLRRWHRDVGLHNWPLAPDELPRQLPRPDEPQPLLVFVHDLASDTLGSFGALQGSEALARLEQQFPGGVYGFEHRTLSCSPVANAIELVTALPQGAHVSLVTLGRGGLVGDLLCVADFGGTAVAPEAQRVELDQLAALLARKQLVVQRYLRVASPANGTALLGESLDLFLSGVLSVVGLAAKADPLSETVYSAFQRVVLEMVRLRADASAIPGLADLVPDAPLARFLRAAPVREGLQMAVIAGDTDGADGWLRRIGLWLMDKVLIGSPYHDMVVDTPSMLAGIAPKAGARARLDARPEVSHFGYFQYQPHVRALRDWLCEANLSGLPGFDALEDVQARLVPPGVQPAALDGVATRGIGNTRKAAQARTSALPRSSRSTLRRQLSVSVHAADLRFLPGVLMLGHYEQDPIAGPQAIVDRELLDQMLSQRYNLGLYPGPIGTACVVLPSPEGHGAGASSELNRGAVIVGLGRFDLPLIRESVTEAVCAGVLRFLLQICDTRGQTAVGLTLNTLLIGTNSASSLSVGASIDALVRGVLEANARFHDTTGLDLRVERLQITELYVDTAITAAYALIQPERLRTLTAIAGMLDTQLTCHGALQRHEGARPRLFDGAAAGDNYWPRLIVTDADTERDLAATGRAPIATRLRYLHVGQRARAETVVQQRQPRQVERLVRDQIDVPTWNPDFSRALFQLMVPHELKDTVRHFARLVLVVDACTANLPWELMLADDPARTGAPPRALSLQIPLVRQLTASDYRVHVRQSMGRTALVIGNPSLAGFLETFPGSPDAPNCMPLDLPGAAQEAETVARELREQGYAVTLLSDPPPQASAVLIALYQRPWRILHVCAHGEFALRSVEGVELTGVLMSDGQMLTAAEIRAMELVPELVFLNCCHLGQASVPAGQGQANLLAASMARELIAVGVRCVVVAGWAVSDAPAMCFGKTFYEKLLGPDGLPFGEAIFRAREATSELAPKDITWGAYQAYGDPGWRAHPQAGSSAERERPKFVAQEELLNALARLRVDATRRARRHPLTPDGREAQRKAVDDLLAQRCEPSWAALPEVQGALGETWFALGEFERAQACFKVAIRGEQDKGVVPIRHIELLANALARRAQQVVEQGDPKAADQLLDEAVKKLELLDQIAADGRGSTPERGALKGSALKRRAELLAREADVDKHLVRESIRSAIRAYIKAGKKPYPRLNALALAALVCKPSTCAGLARRARACGKAARLDSQREPSDAWNMVLTTDACMVELLLSPTEPTPGKERSARDAYQHALSAVPLSPMQLDSMRTHMDLLTLLARALDRPELVDRLCLLRTMV